MRQISDERMDDFEQMALESAKQIRAFFKYEGNDTRYFQKARIGAAGIGAYSRIRSSETNRMALEAAAGRGLLEIEAREVKALPAGKKK